MLTTTKLTKQSNLLNDDLKYVDMPSANILKNISIIKTVRKKTSV